MKEADEKEARINKQADNIRRTRKLEEEKKLGAKRQYERDLELQREKLIELKVKEKVEFEVAQKLEEERVKREAVSYTHLDVYKRQECILLLIQCHLFRSGGFLFSSFLVLSDAYISPGRGI